MKNIPSAFKTSTATLTPLAPLVQSGNALWPLAGSITTDALHRSIAAAIAAACDAELVGISLLNSHDNQMRHYLLHGNIDLALVEQNLTDRAFASLTSAMLQMPAAGSAAGKNDLIQFHAGVQMLDANGQTRGVFFIAGRTAKTLTIAQADVLCQLGGHISTLQQAQITGDAAANDALGIDFTGNGLHHLPDRALFEKQLTRFMNANSMRDEMFAVMSLHVDNFDNITYTMGDQTGQALLKQISERLRNCLYCDDLIGRGDGSHFLLVVRGLNRAADIDVVVRKVLSKCTQPFVVDGQNILVTLSIGTALSALNSDLPSVLMRYADTAMHLAAKNGGNNHLLFRLEMRNHILEQTRIASDLSYALEADQFELYYQAKVDLATREVGGFEALLRWRHPTRGLVSPDDFIPVLEQTGLIVPVGEVVIRQACRQLDLWREAGLRLVPIAINLSARQFESPLLRTVIENCLQEFDISPSLLELEITESCLMRDVDSVARQLQQFSAMGLRISVDDFGTGYSSLAYLKHFKLDALKIDKTFVQGIGINHGDTEITRAVIELAHGLGLRVIAEGVEDGKQLAFLEAHGCDEVQGYHFSRPVPAQDCAQLLAGGFADGQAARADRCAA